MDTSYGKCFGVTFLLTVLLQYSIAQNLKLNFTAPLNVLKHLDLSTTEVVTMNLTCNSSWINEHNYEKLQIKVSSDGSTSSTSSKDIFTINEPTTFLINCSDTQYIEFEILAHQLGHSSLDIVLIDSYSKSHVYSTIAVTVEHKRTPLNYAFVIVIAIFVVLLTFGFGCRINIHDVILILRKPVTPAIGLCCQVVVMPLLGLAISHALDMDDFLGFGLFVVSCCPGGGASNVWTVLLDGDLDLSMTLTLCSKTLALITMPFWLFVSRGLYGDISVSIPYGNLASGLCLIAIPCLFGVLLRYKKPKAADFISKAVKVLSIIFIIWVVVIGSISNSYVFSIMIQRWYILPAAIMLPYIGALLGMIIALIFRQPRDKVTAIAIETGVQDTGVAILLLLTSFGRPAGQIASAVPIAAAIFTPIPFAIIASVMSVYKRCWLNGKCQCLGGPTKKCHIKGGAQTSLNHNNFEATFNGVKSTKNSSHSCDIAIAQTALLDNGVCDKVADYSQTDTSRQ